jgi:hypothetical protein
LSTLVTRPCWVAIVLVVLAGCADSDPLAEETAGETFVQERLERLHPTRAPEEIAVLCREATGRRLSCGSSVTEPGTEAAVRQRWKVDLDRDGRVTEARPISTQGAPKPRERPAQARLALAVATTKGAKRRTRRARRPLEVVRLRIAPRQRVLVCVDTGRGRRLFGMSRRAAVALRGARLRLRLRRRSAVLTVHGRPRAARGRPHGVDIRPGMLRPLRSRNRPCR